MSPSRRTDLQVVAVVVVGGGPAGLMAAESLTSRGFPVALYDSMPSLGRKFLLAGKGGLNLTHSEGLPAFTGRYGGASEHLQPLVLEFGPEALRKWARELGIETFVGSSGRVFPQEMKAAPLLRSWLRRLRANGLTVHVRHRLVGLSPEKLDFSTPEGPVQVRARAVILALGGASWARLGSDGAWVEMLSPRGLAIAPLKSANCGFEVSWSDHFREKFAGAPVKSVGLAFGGQSQQGEFVITAHGLEGSLIYAFSALCRDEIAAGGSALIHLDLAPGRTLQKLESELSRPRGSHSLAKHLHNRAGIEGVKAGLLREFLTPAEMTDPLRLAAAIKALPLRLLATRPLDEAISTAGGLEFSELDENLMVRSWPGLFCAGEMLDWEAPTGGYLLTACFATGRRAGLGAAQWLAT